MFVLCNDYILLGELVHVHNKSLFVKPLIWGVAGKITKINWSELENLFNMENGSPSLTMLPQMTY